MSGIRNQVYNNPIAHERQTPLDYSSGIHLPLNYLEALSNSQKSEVEELL